MQAASMHDWDYVTSVALERFRAKWVPVRVKKTRQNKELFDNFRTAEPALS
jgi:hypothetical protein